MKTIKISDLVKEEFVQMVEDGKEQVQDFMLKSFEAPPVPEKKPHIIVQFNDEEPVSQGVFEYNENYNLPLMAVKNQIAENIFVTQKSQVYEFKAGENIMKLWIE